jgi:hypothetical protein
VKSAWYRVWIKHLILKPVVPITNQRKLENHLDLNIKLQDKLNILKIKKEIYYFRGLLNFIPPISNNINAIGHFIAHCYREVSNTWEKYNDFQPKVKTVRTNTIIKNCQFLIYTK